MGLAGYFLTNRYAGTLIFIISVMSAGAYGDKLGKTEDPTCAKYYHFVADRVSGDQDLKIYKKTNFITKIWHKSEGILESNLELGVGFVLPGTGNVVAGLIGDPFGDIKDHKQRMIEDIDWTEKVFTQDHDVEKKLQKKLDDKAEEFKKKLGADFNKLTIEPRYDNSEDAADSDDDDEIAITDELKKFYSLLRSLQRHAPTKDGHRREASSADEILKVFNSLNNPNNSDGFCPKVPKDGKDKDGNSFKEERLLANPQDMAYLMLNAIDDDKKPAHPQFYREQLGIDDEPSTPILNNVKLPKSQR